MSILNEKTIKPNTVILDGVLGDSVPLWQEIQTFLEEKYGHITEEWKYYGQKYGWTLKIILKKRTIFYFVPLDSYFRISFALGERAVEAVEKSKLPKKMIEELLNSKKYAEGRALKIDVKNSKDVIHVKRIIEIKVAS